MKTRQTFFYLLFMLSMAVPVCATNYEENEYYKVIRVVDGDTIVVLIDGVKEKVNYIGIDTPETVHPSKLVGYCGKEASDFNKAVE